jgi:hypothetical protein
MTIRNLAACLPKVLALLQNLYESPWQLPKNFSYLFDVICRVIRIYDCERAVVESLLVVSQWNQHVTRCFAVSLLMLVFKADFDRRGSVTCSSIDLLNQLTSLMLGLSPGRLGNRPVRIPLFKLLLE